MKDVTTYVGIDAHKRDLFVAMLIGHEQTPVTWQLANEPQAVRRLVRKFEREAPGAVKVFYEAGPCGYALQRQVTTARVALRRGRCAARGRGVNKALAKGASSAPCNVA